MAGTLHKEEWIRCPTLTTGQSTPNKRRKPSDQTIFIFHVGRKYWLSPMTDDKLIPDSYCQVKANLQQGWIFHTLSVGICKITKNWRILVFNRHPCSDCYEGYETARLDCQQLLRNQVISLIKHSDWQWTQWMSKQGME